MIQYLQQHPQYIVAVITVVVAVMKRVLMFTPEQYAALPPRFAAFLKTTAAFFPDLIKVAETAPKIVTGKTDPSKDPQ